MATHRRHTLEFKRQVVQEYLAGETLHGLVKRHDLSRNLIRIWVSKYEAGDLDDDAQAADLLQAYEARIAALERLVGQQAGPVRVVPTLVLPSRRDGPMPRTAASTSPHRSCGCGPAEGTGSDPWDVLGASIALAGAAVIVFGPRPT